MTLTTTGPALKAVGASSRHSPKNPTPSPLSVPFTLPSLPHPKKLTLQQKVERKRYSQGSQDECFHQMMVHEKRKSITESSVFHLKQIIMCCLHFNHFYNCNSNTYLIGPCEDQMKRPIEALNYLIPSYCCYHFYLVSFGI